MKRQLRGYQRPVPFDFKGYSTDNVLISKTEDMPPDIDLSPEVNGFCKRKGISKYLKAAIEIIRNAFASIKELDFIIEKDPDTDDEWLLIDIKVDGTIEEILAYYDVYIEQWVTTAPAIARDKIKLSYGIF